MKDENFKLWWKEVKCLCGFYFNMGNVINYIYIEEFEDCDNQEFVNIINQVFFELFEEYCLEQLLIKFFIVIDLKLCEVFELRVMKLLVILNFLKVCGLDEILNWFFKEYVELLVVLVFKIINFLFKE